MRTDSASEGAQEATRSYKNDFYQTRQASISSFCFFARARAMSAMLIQTRASTSGAVATLRRRRGAARGGCRPQMGCWCSLEALQSTRICSNLHMKSRSPNAVAQHSAPLLDPGCGHRRQSIAADRPSQLHCSPAAGHLPCPRCR